MQPLTVVYHPPEGAPPRFYGWWGEMDFGRNLLKILSTWRQGRVEIIRHTPEAVAEAGDRKTLARACETAVREGYERAKAIR